MAIAASQRIWQAEMDVLLRHMSGLHSSGSPGGFWARGLSQRQRLDTGYGPWQKQTVSGIELGIDRRVAGGATTAWSVGMLAGYSETGAMAAHTAPGMCTMRTSARMSPT